jgi:hypothetical protein
MISNAKDKAEGVIYFEKNLLVPGCGTEAPPSPYFVG